MKKFKNTISLFFLFFAMAGTMLSMMHYHSDGLECLSHAEHQHITENDLFCPVSGIFAVTGDPSQPALNGILTFHYAVIDTPELYLSAQPFVPLLGRAPPFMV